MNRFLRVSEEMPLSIQRQAALFHYMIIAL